MKRLILILVLVFSSMTNYSQVPAITTEQKPYEFILENMLIKHNKTGQYILQIISDNRFEKKTVKIKLGTSPKEALESMLNILAVLKNVDTRFDLQAYTFHVYDGAIVAQHIGYLEFAAGRYQLNEDDMISVIETLIEEYDLPIGKVHLECRELGVRKFYICYEDYGFKSTVQFPKGVPSLSKAYQTGDIISTEDIKILYDYSLSPYVYVNNETLFQRLCKTIFE